MAYAVPKQWSHGDVPTGADMQKYSDGLNAIKDTLDDTSLYNMMAVTPGDDSNWYIVNTHRYLWYQIIDGSNGQLVDPANAENTVSLAETDLEFERVDLQGVAWIYPGKLYLVANADYAFEDVD